MMISVSIFPQSMGKLETPKDSIMVSVERLINAAETIAELRDSISELNAIVVEVQNSNRLQSIMFKVSEQELDLMSRRVTITDGIIDRYTEHLVKDRGKWYNHPMMYFVAGLGTAYVSSIVYKNINEDN